MDWNCHNCKQPVQLEIDISEGVQNTTSLDDIQTCVSYECKNCGAEEMSYQHAVGVKHD